MNMDNLVKTSYSKDDAIVLLKDLSKDMIEMSPEEREIAIQSGKHYSEMLPKENKPSDEYLDIYYRALENNKKRVASDVSTVAEMICNNTVKRCEPKPVLISLARAGIPVGVLIKRYIKLKYNIDCPHYAISIIRDKGIDTNAMEYIYNKEVVENNNSVDNFFFIDGWTGKGVIGDQLKEAVEELTNLDNKWEGLKSDLYVLADPANTTEFCGTHDDYLLPSACLNSTVSGLISRTILNDFIKDSDFHGAVYFNKFEGIDETNKFIDTICKELENYKTQCTLCKRWNNSETQSTSTEEDKGMGVVNRICEKYGVADYKKVKPGIGETTRVLLRRIPWKVIISNKLDRDDADLEHILNLAKTKNIPVETDDIGNYKVCGIIKELSADA